LQAKRETEIDILNGEICRLGALKGIPTPVNSKLIELIKAHEANKTIPTYKTDNLYNQVIGPSYSSKVLRVLQLLLVLLATFVFFGLL